MSQLTNEIPVKRSILKKSLDLIGTWARFSCTHFVIVFWPPLPYATCMCFYLPVTKHGSSHPTTVSQKTFSDKNLWLDPPARFGRLPLLFKGFITIACLADLWDRARLIWEKRYRMFLLYIFSWDLIDKWKRKNNCFPPLILCLGSEGTWLSWNNASGRSRSTN